MTIELTANQFLKLYNPMLIYRLNSIMARDEVEDLMNEFALYIVSQEKGGNFIIPDKYIIK